MKDIHYVNNSGCDISSYFEAFKEAYISGELNEDFADIFDIEFLREYNEDGSDRMIITAKGQLL